GTEADRTEACAACRLHLLRAQPPLGPNEQHELLLRAPACKRHQERLCVGSPTAHQLVLPFCHLRQALRQTARTDQLRQITAPCLSRRLDGHPSLADASVGTNGASNTTFGLHEHDPPCTQHGRVPHHLLRFVALPDSLEQG